MGLDTIEILLWAEQEFGIEIPDSEAAEILTVGQFASCIHGKLLDTQGTRAIAEAEIFSRIKTFLLTAFKIAPDRISTDSQFIKDLRLDH